jgi:hypothetical protein
MGNTNTKTRTTVTDEKDLVPLPFYASPETLPEKLPSCEEIEAASSSETLLVDTSSRKVVHCEIRCSDRLLGRANTPILTAQSESIAVLDYPTRICHVQQREG